MDRYEMLDHIRAHSVMVARVARVIARSLKRDGMAVSVSRVTVGALLHDIGKTASLKTGGDHAEMGRLICIENQFSDVADIVGEHVKIRQYRPEADLSEKEIVYYSDKRVNHDQIVSLDDRLAYILERYGGNHELIHQRIRDNFELCRRVEARLFGLLDFAPESLPRLAEKEGLF
jgi:putative nucleotidyltransferase with HDIG domain